MPPKREIRRPGLGSAEVSPEGPRHGPYAGAFQEAIRRVRHAPRRYRDMVNVCQDRLSSPEESQGRFVPL